MIYTIKEYSEIMLFNGKKKSVKTIIRRIKSGNLPTNHRVKLIGKNYAIEIKSDFDEKLNDR